MPRDTQDPDQPFPDFAYGTLTLSGPPFQCGSAIRSNRSVGPPTPSQPMPTRFGLLRFRSPLLTESSLFLRVLRCFTSPSSLRHGYLFTMRCPGIPQGGFPHSEICGSQPYHDSPQLFAVVHVLPRPLAPRHPPYALRSLPSAVMMRRPRSRRSLPSCSSSSLSYSVLNVPAMPDACAQTDNVPALRPSAAGLPSQTGHLPRMTAKPCVAAQAAMRQWACVDSNHGPLRYQHSALTD